MDKLTQDIITTVEGIGVKSVPYRNRAINENTIYNFNGDNLLSSLGKYVNTSEIKTPINLSKYGLFDYTYKSNTDYSNNLNIKYNNDYENGDISSLINKNITTQKWGGNYTNYIDYIENVYGDGPIIFETIDKLLTKVNFDTLLKNNSVGTVNNIDVYSALNGVITTNINNFKNTDTALGVSSNYNYAKSLQDASRYYTLKNVNYITPDTYLFYGMNESNINNISDRFQIDKETGRTYDEYYLNIYDKTGVSVVDLSGINPYTTINNKTKTFIENSLNKNISNPIDSNYNSKIGEQNNNQYFEFEKITTDYDKLINSIYDVINNTNNNTLLNKTNKLFSERKIGSIVNNFHTHEIFEYDGITSDTPSKTMIQNSTSKYGLSRGRNLLKKTPNNINGYENPYCRVWTAHYGYNTMNKLIRPLMDENNTPITLGDFQKDLEGYVRTNDDRISKYTVLNDNGLVNITPSLNGKVDVKNTMFSIENLAWKDVINGDVNNKYISKEQIGPLGGRIMWFPPYNIEFSENVNTQWNEEKFIGRGESLYTYNNTSRRGTLSFDIIVDHPSIIDEYKKGNIPSASSDEELLRFFAGCDVLDIKRVKTSNNNSQQIQPTREVPKTVINDNTPPSPIEFSVYFPNNYSGVDDFPNNSESSVDALLYLFCGVGTQNSTEILNLKGIQNYNVGYEMSISEKGISSVDDGELTYEGKVYPNWKYRVDKDKAEEILKYNINYIDNTQAQLNNILSNNDTNSFSEILLAIYCVKEKKDISTIYNEIPNLEVFSDKNNIKEDNIKKLISIFNGYSIKKININSYASTQGVIDRNIGLANERGETIKSWLKYYLKEKQNIIDVNIKSIPYEGIKSSSVNDLSMKKQRSANIKIEFNTPSDINTTLDLSSDNSIIMSNTVNINNDDINNTNEITINTDYNITSKIKYDNESNNFNVLASESKIIQELLSEKIQYFSPAYLSMTPEGFNSRLSFLHQCTRQGNTNSISDNENSVSTAGNLAFGRAPYCVLRIGDFYNTKIIIENININFKPLQWDLNTEGIGVQPMLAKINMGFVFIGGSDLGGPIARLQNAVSFNYYSNTTTYDERSDKVEYVNDNNGNYVGKYSTFNFDN